MKKYIITTYKPKNRAKGIRYKLNTQESTPIQFSWPVAPGGLRRYAHPATPTRNPPLPLYLYTPPIRRYKTDTRLLSPFSSPTRRLAGAPPPPLSGSAAAATDDAAHPWNALRYAAPRCVFLRPRLRRRRTRASHGSGGGNGRSCCSAAAEEEPRGWGPRGGWPACGGRRSPRA